MLRRSVLLGIVGLLLAACTTSPSDRPIPSPLPSSPSPVSDRPPRSWVVMAGEESRLGHRLSKVDHGDGVTVYHADDRDAEDEVVPSIALPDGADYGRPFSEDSLRRIEAWLTKLHSERAR